MYISTTLWIFTDCGGFRNITPVIGIVLCFGWPVEDPNGGLRTGLNLKQQLLLPESQGKNRTGLEPAEQYTNSLGNVWDGWTKQNKHSGVLPGHGKRLARLNSSGGCLQCQRCRHKAVLEASSKGKSVHRVGHGTDGRTQVASQ